MLGFFCSFFNKSLRCNTQSEGPSVVNLRALHPFFFYIALSDTVFSCLPCIVIAVHVQLFTVKRFQHRKLSSFNACFLQFRPSVPFSSVAKKGTSLCTLGGSKCLKVRFLCFLRASSISPASAQRAAVFFSSKTLVKRTSHAMQKYLSLQQHRCLLPAAPQAEVAGGWVGVPVPQCFPHSHMLVSQVGDRLPSPGIRWMSDLNMWLSTLSPLWLLSSFNSSSAPAAAWVQF